MVGYSLMATRFAAIDDVMVCSEAYTMSAIGAKQLNEPLLPRRFPSSKESTQCDIRGLSEGSCCLLARTISRCVEYIRYILERRTAFETSEELSDETPILGSGFFRQNPQCLPSEPTPFSARAHGLFRQNPHPGNDHFEFWSRALEQLVV